MSIQVYNPDSKVIIHSTNVNFTKQTIEAIINLVQYDKTIPLLAVKLYNGDSEYVIPDTFDASIRWGKRDRTYSYNAVLGCDSTHTILYIAVTEQMTSLEGTIYPIIELRDGTKVANSSYIRVDIHRNSIQDSDSESTYEHGYLEKILEEALTAKDTATASATAAKTSETNSKTSETNALASKNAAASSASAALASQNAAKTSETNSKTSETNAKASETAAKTSETNTATSEANALSYKNAAASSASAASASQTAAKTSETNAASSASAALASQNAASASQTAAKISETNAKTSETNAASSASAASASETAAKTSETNAKTSETNAASSASSALSSKTAAASSATAALASQNAAKTSETNASNSASAASTSATSASSSAASSSASQLNSEAWAVGQRNGTDVGSTDSTYHNNSKYYSTQAAGSATSASSSSTSASTSASAASASQTAAKTSETNAKASETAAKTSETNALASKNAAASSASAALASQNAAKTSETNAASNASNAASSASAASASETAAKTSETNAKTSETNAASSASSALSSKTAAATSASNAASSATAAAASQVASKTSETNASNSAAAAKTSETNAKTSETNASNSAAEAKTYYDNIQNVLALTNGGFSVSGALSTITLLGDYSLCTSIDMLKKKWPFNILYIDTKCDSYKSDGTKLGYNDSYLVMPNCWYWADIANHAWYISNYKVNNLYQKVYPGEFKELLLAVYKATSIDSMLHSLAGYIPATNIDQSTIISQLPYYKIDNKGTLRRSEYQDYRIRGLYNILSTIYLGTMNSQNIYYGVVAYGWTGSYTTDITDTDSQKTGVTEMTTSIGYLPSGNVNTGEITGTSSTTSLNNGKRPFKILGVENPYGLLWENLYGLVHNSGALLSYNGNSDSLTASDLVPSSSNIIYETTGVTLPTSNGNQAEQSSVNLFNVPISIGGSTSTYTGDYYWYSDRYRIFMVGGAWYSGPYAGLFSLGADEGWGRADVTVGVRLTFER